MKRLRYVLVVAAAVLVSTVMVRSAEAQATGCLPDVGKRVPVLFVHGFNADERTWGLKEDPSTMIGRVSGLPDVFADTFDYRDANKLWVTHPEIGPKLADRITCMAQSSREQGGKGKVVVIAHSMGGLATRFAMAQMRFGRRVADDVGLVVTIATPNTGSDFARDAARTVRGMCALAPALRPTGVLCDPAVDLVLTVLNAMPALQTGSAELAALPGWPKGVPVLAMAGNVTPTYGLPWVPLVDGPPSGADTLVTTRSALQGQVVNGIGGTREFGCKAMAPLLPLVTRTSCEHGALVQNPNVQKQTADVIGQYVAQLNAPPPTTRPPITAAQQCASAATFTQLLRKQAEGKAGSGSTYVVQKGPVCEGGKAGAIVEATMGQIAVVLKLQNGSWQVDKATEYFSKAECASQPAKIRVLFESIGGFCV